MNFQSNLIPRNNTLGEEKIFLIWLVYEVTIKKIPICLTFVWKDNKPKQTWRKTESFIVSWSILDCTEQGTENKEEIPLIINVMTKSYLTYLALENNWKFYLCSYLHVYCQN